ncbi:hypothetical protein BJV82DRAFT_590371 [Fennellomyces sp. T-0311]|nr:hypothetical protein BJV82DRAFT_590371 [Fennellomyces sp. T-0311]
MFLRQLAAIVSVVALFLILSAHADTVEPRGTAKCQYIYPKIYCYGGRGYNEDINGSYTDSLTSNIFNTLDLSEEMSISDLQNRWTPMEQDTPGPNTEFAFVADPKHNAILMDGGSGLSNDSTMYRAQYRSIIYNVTTESWNSDIQMREDNFIFHSAILGPNSTAYLFGGRVVQENILTEPTFYPLEMYLFNFATASWGTSTAVRSLRDSLIEYRAALGKDGVSIYYIGGVYPDEPKYANMTDYYYGIVPMSEVVIFNTNTSEWRTQNTTGETPFTRIGHTLTLKPSTGELILLGGSFPSNITDFQMDYFYLLDTESMTWYTRALGLGQDLDYNVTEIADHSAVLVDDRFLFVMFGLVPPGRATSTVRVLDIETWSWVNVVSAVQVPEDADGSSSEASGGTSAGTIAGAVVGSIAGVALIGAIIAFVYLRRKRQAKTEQDAKVDEINISPEDRKDTALLSAPTSPGALSGSTQVPNTFDEPRTPDITKFYGVEKPDGASNNNSPQVLVMTPVKPDGS